jgi:anaerobic ribonucleoside-triphosphate reductase activating protein
VDAVRVGISRLHHPVWALGPGRRVGIWFQGCSIHCAGCMSRDTWDPAPADQQVPLDDVTAWVDGLPDDDVDGVTISGGEPFDQPAALAELTRWLRGRFDPDRVDLLVYSGYEHATLVADHPGIVAGLDVLITEPFRGQAGGPQLRWRGSPNQRLVAISDLGRRRYAEHREAPADTGLQIDVHEGTVRLIGVPRPGDLARLEQGLARRGIALDQCSWNRDGAASADPPDPTAPTAPTDRGDP